MSPTLTTAGSTITRDENLAERASANAESLLAEMAVPAHLTTIDLSRVDVEASLKNQARVGLPRNDDLVESYREAMEHGNVFPAIVVRTTAAGGYVVLDGNHRVAAAQALGQQYFPAYVAEVNDLFVRDILTWRFNHKEGQRPNKTEAIAHGVNAVRQHNVSVDQAAKWFNVTPFAIRSAITAEDQTLRLRGAGVRMPERMSKTTLGRFSRLVNDPPAKAVAELALDAALQDTEVAELIDEVRATRSEADALAVVNAWRTRPDVHARYVRRGGRVAAAGPRRKYTPRTIIEQSLRRATLALGRHNIDELRFSNAVEIEAFERLAQEAYAAAAKAVAAARVRLQGELSASRRAS